MAPRHPRIVIIGAGPTGLGAAYRCEELGHDDYVILEREQEVGGLARSFRDEHGFTWDIGGHVLFTKYPYFRELYEKLMEDEYTDHVREAWIWMHDRFLPYPFQYNLHHLPSDEAWACVEDLLNATHNGNGSAVNFRTWLLQTFGEAMAKAFLLPYNEKAWQCDLTEMSCRWIADRVPVPDVTRILRNLILRRDDMRWGPNHTFKFPLRGGTGDFFRRFLPVIHDHVHLSEPVVHIDTAQREVRTERGVFPYDALITTMPLTEFLVLSDLEELRLHAAALHHTSGVILGIGVRGGVPEQLEKKCWIYYPELEIPFYRVTVFSNYSRYNAPTGCYSLMAEVSLSSDATVDLSLLAKESLTAMHAAQLIGEGEVITQFCFPFRHSYPVPTRDLDTALKRIHTTLLPRGIYSRGRFGAWKYEIGNMDHSVMQGVEAVNAILRDEPETVWSH